MMSIGSDLAVQITSGVIAGLILLLYKKLTQPRTNLITYFVHGTGFQISNPNQQPFVANTHSIVVYNSGKVVAKNVTITHIVEPSNISVFPLTLQRQLLPNPNGTTDIVIPALHAKEQATISYLYFSPNTWVDIGSTVKCDEQIARVVDVIPVVRANPFVLRTNLALVLIGLSTVLYYLITYIPIWLSKF